LLLTPRNHAHNTTYYGHDFIIITFLSLSFSFSFSKLEQQHHDKPKSLLTLLSTYFHTQDLFEMKRRAPPSPLDLAISSLTNFTPNGAFRGVAPGYKSKTNPHANSNANVNTNAYVSSKTSTKVTTNPTTVTTSNKTSKAYPTSNTSFKSTNPNTVTSAYVTSNPNASSNLNPNTKAGTNTQAIRPAPGIESERPYHETYSLKMARFWAAKAQALKEPFIPAGDDVGEGAIGGDVQYTGSTAGEMVGGEAGIDWVCAFDLVLCC
jgi:hypothetical protein